MTKTITFFLINVMVFANAFAQENNLVDIQQVSGSNFNEVEVSQVGDFNSAVLLLDQSKRQDLNLIQNGDYHSAQISLLSSNRNVLDIQQLGSQNQVIMDFYA